MAVNGGVKNWVSGQVLDAADLNEFIADQTIARFETIAARTAAYGVSGAPSLQTGLFSWVESTEKLYFYDGSAWVEVGAQIEDNEVTTAKILDGAVTSAKILDGTIVNADINASAAIAYSKLNLSNSVSTTDLASGAPRAGFRSTRNAQTGTSYTIALSDLGSLVELSNASPITLTIPLESSVAFAVGDRVDVLQTGAGQVTIAGAAGVTVNAFDGGLKLNGQWAAATLIKRATNTWVAIGNLTT